MTFPRNEGYVVPRGQVGEVMLVLAVVNGFQVDPNWSGFRHGNEMSDPTKRLVFNDPVDLAWYVGAWAGAPQKFADPEPAPAPAPPPAPAPAPVSAGPFHCVRRDTDTLTAIGTRDGVSVCMHRLNFDVDVVLSPADALTLAAYLTAAAQGTPE